MKPSDKWQTYHLLRPECKKKKKSLKVYIRFFFSGWWIMIFKINFGLILLVIFGLLYHVQPVSSEPSFLDTTKSGSSEVEKTETIEVVYMSSKIFSRLLDPVTHLKLRKKNNYCCYNLCKCDCTFVIVVQQIWMGWGKDSSTSLYKKVKQYLNKFAVRTSGFFKAR